MQGNKSSRILFLIVLRYLCFSTLNLSKGDHVPIEYLSPLDGASENAMALPEIENVKYTHDKETNFSGKYDEELFTSYSSSVLDDIENSIDPSTLLSWETVWPNGKRRSTYVKVNKCAQLQQVKGSLNLNQTRSLLKNLSETINQLKSKKRKNRAVFEGDDRMYIPTEPFGVQEPFVCSVKVSTGCTGIIVSPRHVLTAAHCVHDQSDYLQGTRDLKVGLLCPKGKVRWIPVKNIKISKGWIRGGRAASQSYDYALLHLKKKHNRPCIGLSISGEVVRNRGERIYFTSFEDDKPPYTLWYRSCTLKEQDNHFLYHHCDAQPGSSGAGVYAWDFNVEQDRWDRKIIGVFSGNRWRLYDDWLMQPRNFNVAVRITPCKYVQICKWMGKIGKTLCHGNNFNMTKLN